MKKEKTIAKPFRVWDLQQKLFVYFDFEDIGHADHLYDKKERYKFVHGSSYRRGTRHKYPNLLSTRITNTDNIIQRFIGLNDKNGRAIYEGDILKFNCGGNYKAGKVVYFQQGFYIESEYGALFPDTISTIKESEVIQNIFENNK